MAKFETPELPYATPPWATAAGAVVTNTGEYTLPATAAAGDIIKLCVLPGTQIPVDITAYADKLDTNIAPAIALSFGLLNDGEDDLDAVFIEDSGVAQTGGIARAEKIAALTALASEEDRTVACKITTGAATAASGKVGVRILYTSV